jgi:hypothetical protein
MRYAGTPCLSFNLRPSRAACVLGVEGLVAGKGASIDLRDLQPSKG